MSGRSLAQRTLLSRLAGSVALVLFALMAACSDDGVSPQPVPVPVAEVIVLPETNYLAEGEQDQYVITLRDASGRPLEGRAITWTTSDPLIATVSAAGLVTAHSKGVVTIRATSESVTDEVLLTVFEPPVVSVELSHTTASIEEGESLTMTAVARDADGRILDGRAATWSSDDPSVVSVDASGRLTGNKPGQSRVVVTIEGRTASAVVTVRAISVASVTVSPSGFVIEIGETRQMAAVAKDARGRVLPDRTVQWSVDSDAAIISPDGKVMGVRNAYITIQASSEGVTGAAVATVVPTEPTEFDLVYHRHSNSGDSELFVLTPGTGTAPQRLNAGTVSRTPTPSPSGSRIAFAVSMTLQIGGRIDDIFAVDRNGMNMKQLTNLAGADDSPAWSPNADRIAFHHWDALRSDIWIMNADGSAPQNLTGDMPAEGYRSEPAWSADGSRIAFSERQSGPNGTTSSIWIMNADGSGRQAVISDSPAFDASPTWSPDGTRLAFVRFYGAEADITIVRIADGSLTRLPLAGLEGKPAWSPDGSLIAFSSGARNELFTIQPDGTRLRQRTLHATWGGGLAPAWIRR
jgi:uncharacterized protein YjdB